MHHFEITSTHELTPAQAWRRLFSLERHTAAVPLTTVTAAGPLGPHARFTARTRLGPFTCDDEMLITAWDPPRRAEIRKVGRCLTGTITIELTPQSQGVMISWQQHFDAPGVPAGVIRLATPLVRRGYQRALTRILGETGSTTHRFGGYIAGVGTASGTRLVLGAWMDSEHGPFADVMIAHPDGRRELLAPDQWVADFVQSTYSFDDVRVIDMSLAWSGHRQVGNRPGTSWHVTAGPLEWRFTVGSRNPWGYLMRLQPPGLKTTLWWAKLINPIAKMVFPGVATWGTAGNDRTEWYASTDLHCLTDSYVTYEGQDMGKMTTIEDPGFGFSSTPPIPSITAVVSHVRIPTPH